VFDPYKTTGYKIGSAASVKTVAGGTSSTFINGLRYSNGAVGGELHATTTYWSKSYSSGMHITSFAWYDVETITGTSKLKYQELGDYFTFNVSNNRKNCSWVFGHGNYLTGLAEQYYLEDGTHIVDSTNLDGNYDFTFFDDFYTQYGGKSGVSGSGAKYTYASTYGSTMNTLSIPKNEYASVLSIATYDNFLMKTYWIPVPKGLWYKWHGQDYQIPENGWFDLISGLFKQSVGGEIYAIKETNGESNVYDYFDNWYYDTSEIDYIVSIANTTKTYEQPDAYAVKVRELDPGLVFPVSQLTADADNRVVGEWYFSGD
jgi:hypothetical protein